MKKLFVWSSLVIMLLSSCATQKQSNYTDDVYANPKEDRIEEARLAAIAKQEKEARQKKYDDSIAAEKQAQKEKDDANPYYKDREFKYDDYYDYEYATRVRRFDNHISGLSYYDNYYTNSYWYSGNPYNYGVSVYNGYSWWGPSYNSYSYSPSVAFYANWGWGYGNQFGCYSGYNPYMAGYMNGYNNGFNNGFYGNPYGYGSPYGYGYPYAYGYGSPYGYGGWNNPYNNGWGYYNSYDLNSSYTYGPRASHGGGNSRRTTNPGMSNDDSYYKKYANEIATQQAQAIKFAEITPRKNVYENSNGGLNGTGGIKTPPVTNGNNNTPIKGSTYPTKNEVNHPTYSEPIKNPNGQPIKNPNGTGGIKNPPVETPPIKHEPIKDPRTVRPIKDKEVVTPSYETPVKQNNNYQTPSTPNYNNNQTPSTPNNNNNNNNNGGGNVPSNNGGHRPR